MVYKPLDLFLDHLLLRNEHVFKNFHQFSLKGGVCYSLSHLHDLYNRFLQAKYQTKLMKIARDGSKIEQTKILTVVQTFTEALKRFRIFLSAQKREKFGSTAESCCTIQIENAALHSRKVERGESES